ncbi:hypothetical protein ES703_94324 [subsurface metagenome]
MAGITLYFSFLYISAIFGGKRHKRYILDTIFGGVIMRNHVRKLSKGFKD